MTTWQVFLRFHEALQCPVVWAYGQIDADWAVEGLYVHAQGDLRLAEVRLYPNEPQVVREELRPTVKYGEIEFTTPVQVVEGPALGSWSGPDRLERMRPPRNEVSKQLLKSVPIDEMNLEVRERLRQAKDELERDPGSTSLPPEWVAVMSQPVIPNTNLTPSKVEFLQAAYLATREAKLSREGLAATLSDMLRRRITPVRVAEMLRGARNAGYLTKPGSGRRRAELTPLGDRLAEAYLTKSGEQRRRPLSIPMHQPTTTYRALAKKKDGDQS